MCDCGLRNDYEKGTNREVVMKLTYRITVSGMTTQLEAMGTMEAINRVLKMVHIQDHINRTVSQYGTFQLSVDSIK